MTKPRDRLSGLHILVVEDELLIAMDLQELLERLDCRIVAMVSKAEDALERVRGHEKLDGALLDLNLQDTSSERVAEELKARAVPFIVVTGYAKSAGDSSVLKDAPRLNKPFSLDRLTDLMVDTFVR